MTAWLATGLLLIIPSPSSFVSSLSDMSWETTIPTASSVTRTYSPTIVTSAARSLELTPRIYLTRRNIGMKLASFVTNVEPAWWTNNLVPRLIVFTADLVTTPSSPPDATAAGTCSRRAWRRWSTRRDSGTRSALSAAPARTPSELRVLSPRSTTSIVQNVMKKSLLPSASSAARWEPTL